MLVKGIWVLSYLIRESEVPSFPEEHILHSFPHKKKGENTISQRVELLLRDALLFMYTKMCTKCKI